MALRCIAQAALAAITETTLVDGSQVQPIHLRSLTFCERGGAAVTFRLRLALGAAAVDNKQYLYYNLPIVPNDSFTLSLDIGMLPGDQLIAYASTANLSINLFAE